MCKNRGSRHQYERWQICCTVWWCVSGKISCSSCSDSRAGAFWSRVVQRMFWLIFHKHRFVSTNSFKLVQSAANNRAQLLLQVLLSNEPTELQHLAAQLKDRSLLWSGTPSPVCCRVRVSASAPPILASSCLQDLQHFWGLLKSIVIVLVLPFLLLLSLSYCPHPKTAESTERSAGVMTQTEL